MPKSKKTPWSSSKKPDEETLRSQKMCKRYVGAMHKARDFVQLGAEVFVIVRSPDPRPRQKGRERNIVISSEGDPVAHLKRIEEFLKVSKEGCRGYQFYDPRYDDNHIKNMRSAIREHGFPHKVPEIPASSGKQNKRDEEEKKKEEEEEDDDEEGVIASGIIESLHDDSSSSIFSYDGLNVGIKKKNSRKFASFYSAVDLLVNAAEKFK